MIQQMSLLVRTFDISTALATGGTVSFDELTEETTMKTRQASTNNPVSIDMVGDLKSVDRRFTDVPSLFRLSRQHLGACAGIPEELLWSAERGAFASGDQTEGALEKQWEGVKYTHIRTADDYKKIAMIQVIDALGVGRDVMKALPYTTISFENPTVANAETRAKVAESLAKSAYY
jgi:hypothetical protein